MAGHPYVNVEICKIVLEIIKIMMEIVFQIENQDK